MFLIFSRLCWSILDCKSGKWMELPKTGIFSMGVEVSIFCVLEKAQSRSSSLLPKLFVPIWYLRAFSSVWSFAENGVSFFQSSIRLLYLSDCCCWLRVNIVCRAIVTIDNKTNNDIKNSILQINSTYIMKLRILIYYFIESRIIVRIL